MFSFFKKECYCNQHDDLNKLQELNKKLKELKEQLHDQTKMPAGIPVAPWVESYINYYDNLKYFTELMTRAMVNRMTTEDFIKVFDFRLKELGEINKPLFLKEVGKFFIHCAEYAEVREELIENISNTEKEIKQLKEKLKID